MHNRPPYFTKAAALVAALALGVAVSGCGNDTKTDLSNGKDLFIATCGGCHTMARANTVGTVGPNLDDAFRRAREDGMGNTIEGVVLSQIRWPTPNLYPQSLVMPADIVTGSDAKDVSAYVAYAAAREGEDSGPLADIGGGSGPEGLFKTNCGSCHTLAAAGASGTSGPDLDKVKLAEKPVAKQIVDGGGGMPPFGGTLSKEQITELAKYVVDVGGK